MPASPVLRFSQRHERNGQKLFWGRADLDGFPYRGERQPFYTQEEYDERVVRVADPKNGFFDVALPEENAAYLAVMEAVANGWFRFIHLERFWRNTTKHYVEWVEYFMEDGTRTPFMSPSVVEMTRGQESLPGVPTLPSPDSRIG